MTTEKFIAINVGLLLAIFFMGPWVVFVIERIWPSWLNPFLYWDWCYKKQRSLRDRKPDLPDLPTGRQAGQAGPEGGKESQ